MAKVSFFAADGEETSYKLFPQRPLHIGRDPGNDVVLRDAKVSRQHAQIIFERGFFVLHDLESANGSYVNGRKIRVAPLTNGAELKLGNSKGRFTEELGAEVGATVSHDGAQGMPDAPLPKKDPSERDPIAKSVNLITVERDPADKPKDPDPLSARLAADRLTIVDRSLPADSICVRGSSDAPLFFLKRTSGFAYLISALMLMMVLIAGSSVTLFLGLEKRLIPAVFAFALTVAFVAAMMGLFPRRTIAVFLDEALTSVGLIIEQEGPLVFPSVSFSARTTTGELIGRIKKNAIRSMVRKRWQLLLRESPSAALVAVEDSAWRGFLRKLFGNGFGKLITNYDIATASSHLAFLRRRDQGWRDKLEWQSATDNLDNRLIVAFLAVLYSVERA